MAAIYGASTITIAAVKASNGDSGCFAVTRELEGREITTLEFSQIRLSGVCARQVFSHLDFAAIMTAGPGAGPLFNRAWTLQEELLSTRVLYFTSDEVVWQCNRSCDCQCGGIKDQNPKDEELGSLKFEHYPAIRRSPGARDLRYHWAQIIMQYTGRHVTRETDRLPSLSGLACQAQKAGLGKYIAGMWLNDLPLWLTWACVHSLPEAYSTTFVAPSWSWASIPSGNQVFCKAFRSSMFGKYTKRDVRITIQIEDVHCEASGSDPRGALSSGFLKLRGPVVDVNMKTAKALQAEWRDMPFESDYAYGLIQKWYGQRVRCLLLCTILDTPYYLVLVPSGRGQTYKRIGIGDTRVIEEEHGRTNAMIKNITALWFKNAVQEEIVII
jgi:hypothetical protein